MTGSGRRTTPRIRVLPDHVANQIAAGEVVERPASVVKELVENALDAGARTVRVSIERGGKGRIRVADDGTGMLREDVLACLDRHATSKIRHAEDLNEIRTLGFRGEALPSIAAVSRMAIETAAQGAETGTRLRVLAGRIQGGDELARRPGTTVDVRNIFLNTPVRARFLKSVGVEKRAIAEAVHVQALANPGVRFIFEADGKGVLDLPAATTAGERVGAIWPDAAEAGLLPLSGRRGDFGIEGVIQRPDHVGKGFRRVHLLVNGRPFRDPGLVAAAERGYRTTVAERMRPWLFLFLTVPRPEVDVNVHPGKAEVRFRNRLRVENFVEASVREALAGVESAATWMVREGVRGNGGETPAEDEVPQMRLFPQRGPGEGRAGGDAQAHEAPAPALLQVHNSFIMAETPDGVINIDQHAAHERVLYERIMEGLDSGADLGQRLLFPFTVRLTRPEVEAIEAVKETLAQVGFVVESFGADTVLVQSVPSPHRHFDAQSCIREMIAEIVEGSELLRSARNQREGIAMTFACKGAIKAGQKLAPEEMQELFDQLFATSLPYHDVHGRPTVVRLSLDELGQKFGRT
ncbi:MAG: DNA mismatch repair endonuclease MutL [Gemmatimonadetes bacterium]|nr:DNA mismatch repair endonuclease MutL [Gemmatimonadota bacterium]